MSCSVQHKIKKRVCVTGLGRVGLPIACVLATSGYAVLGVDTDDEVVRRVQSADLINSEKNLQSLLITAIRNGNLEVSKKSSSAEVHIIAVPTLLRPGNQPDISYVNKAIDAIKNHLRSHDLVLIESTCPIGTTEIVANKLRSICSNVYVAYCPERILPGNSLYEMVQALSTANKLDHQEYGCGEEKLCF